MEFQDLFKIILNVLLVGSRKLVGADLVRQVLLHQVDPSPHRFLVIIESSSARTTSARLFGVADLDDVGIACFQRGWKFDVLDDRWSNDVAFGTLDRKINVLAVPLGAGVPLQEINVQFVLREALFGCAVKANRHRNRAGWSLHVLAGHRRVVEHAQRELLLGNHFIADLDKIRQVFFKTGQAPTAVEQDGGFLLQEQGIRCILINPKPAWWGIFA